MKNNQTNHNLIPKLRFPEFKDSGSWEVKKLNELLFETKLRNRKLLYGPNEVLSVSGEYGCVNQIEFMGRSYAGVSVKDYHIVQTGDIVYTKSPLKRNPFGIIKVNKGKNGIVSTLYAVYRVTDIGDATYLDQYFCSDYNLNSYLQPIVRKGAKNDMKVNNFTVLGGNIIVPPKKEQQKIADCLSSLDDLIAAHNQKLTALKNHKKGLMQQLFPAEGETVPKLRFPEFEDTGDWEKKRISDIGDVVTGSTPSTTESQYYKGKRFFVSPADMSDVRYITTTKTTLTEIGFQQTRPLRANSILFVCIGSTIGKISQTTEECATNQQINSIIPYSKYSDNFVYSILEQRSSKIAELAGRQAVPIINKTLFSEVKIMIPTLPEQKKIAECYSCLDDLITVQTKKIIALKKLKNGLMQQLFTTQEKEEE